MGDAEEQAQLALLQRRLYRADASPEDLQRYEALRDRLAAQSPPPPASAAERPAATRTRHRSLLVAGAVLGVVALAAAVAVLQVPRQREASALPGTPSPVPSQMSERFGDDDATPVGTTVEVAVDGARVLAQRFSGSGRAAVPLITGGAPLQGGLLTITLRSRDERRVSWQTEVGDLQPVSPLTGMPDTPTTGRASRDPVSVRYSGAPPTAVDVRAPTGTGWTLVVAFSR